MALWLLSALLVSFVVAQNAPWPYENKGFQLAEGKPLIIQNLRANLASGANISLTHKAALQVCFQENFPVPSNASNWKWSCTHHFSFSSVIRTRQSNVVVYLRNSSYNVGIYFDGSVNSQTDTITFTAGRNNDSCPIDKVYNTRSCVTPTQLDTEDENQTSSFVANVPQIFSFVVLPLTGSITVSTTNSSTPLYFALRRAGAPAPIANSSDGTYGVRAVFNFPRPGTYYLYVLSNTTRQAYFNLSVEDCHYADHASGPGCTAEFNHDFPIESVTGSVSSYYYWAVFNVGPSKPLRVTVYPLSGQALPSVYASRGNLPQKGNAEISNCNIASGCSTTANIIYWAPKSNETWYVAVQAAPGTNGTRYGIWFETICYPGCTSAGTCTESGPNMGTCVCTDPNESGLGCQMSEQASQKYVVLGAIWGTAIGVTIVVLVIYFMTSQKVTYERLA